MGTLALLAVMLVPLIACGSKPAASRYDKAISKQESCCLGLQDLSARQGCEQSIVRLGDGSSKDSDVNEATFRCVERNFICNAETGKATPEANQATLDCLTDLGQKAIEKDALSLPARPA